MISMARTDALQRNSSNMIEHPTIFEDMETTRLSKGHALNKERADGAAAAAAAIAAPLFEKTRLQPANDCCILPV